MTSTDRQRARAARLQSMIDAEHVRFSLGRGARYRRLPDGKHVITYCGERFVGATVDEAIEKVKGDFAL